ncbi:MAG: PAS domain S-box protein [Methanomassiliicoccales archaeon]|nr:PAS domain S-box protein [Methanomassiliicoccales archaeon]
MIKAIYVDDEEPLLDIAHAFLEGNDRIELDTTTDPREALAKVLKSEYDIIVSDYQMPGMDGLRLLREIRTANNKIPFILFTGKGREEVVIQALNEGADFYLQKGGQPRPLFAELAHMIILAVQKHRSTESLLVSETRLKRAEEAAGFGHWEWNFNTGMITASHGAVLICGLNKCEIAVEEFMEMTTPESKEKLYKSMTDLRRGRSYNLDYRIKRKDNQDLVELHAYAENDLIKKVGFGVIQDITAKRTAERELAIKVDALSKALNDMTVQDQVIKKSEARFRSILRNIPIGVWLADSEGRMVLCNAAFENIWGKGVKLGKDEGFNFKARKMPSQVPIAPDHWVRGKATKRDAVVENELLEVILSDGSHKYVRNWTIPIDNEEGEISGAMIINQDVTEATETFNMLTENEGRYRTYIESTNEGVFVANYSGHIIDVNRAGCDLLRFPRDELLSLTWRDVLHVESLEQALISLEELRQSGKISVEAKAMRKDGKTIDIRLNAVRLPNGHLLGMTSDISEIMKAKKRMMEYDDVLKFLRTYDAHSMKMFEEGQRAIINGMKDYGVKEHLDNAQGSQLDHKI